MTGIICLSIIYLGILTLSSFAQESTIIPLTLNQNSTFMVISPERQLFKVHSCFDIEVNVSVVGRVKIRGGPFLLGSMSRFYSQFDQSIQNDSKTFSLRHPFSGINQNNTICQFYFQIFGQNIEQEFQNSNSTLLTIPTTDSDPTASNYSILITQKKSNNQIKIIKRESDQQSSLLYANSSPEEHNIIYILENSNKITNSFGMQVFNEIPLVNGFNDTQLPQLRIISNSKQQYSTKKNNINLDQNTSERKKKKNSFLNMNFNLQLSSETEYQTTFLLENTSRESSSRSSFEISLPNYSRFAKIQFSEISGLNYQLSKSNTQHIFILNNEGNFSLDLFSNSLDQLEIQLYRSDVNAFYSNKFEEIKEFERITPSDLSSISQRIYLFGIQQSDQIKVISRQNKSVNFLLELKKEILIIDSPKKASDEEIIDFIEYEENGEIFLKRKQNYHLKKSFVFFATKEQVVREASIVGESEKGLLYFAEVQNNSIISKDEVLRSKGYSIRNQDIYLAIRGYDSMNEVVLHPPVLIWKATPEQQWGDWIIWLIVSILAIFLCLGVMSMVIFYRKRVKANRISQDIESQCPFNVGSFDSPQKFEFSLTSVI